MSNSNATAPWPTGHGEVKYGTSTTQHHSNWDQTLDKALNSADPDMVAAAKGAKETNVAATARFIGWRDALRTNGLLSKQQSDDVLDLAFKVGRECEWLEFLSRTGDPVQGSAGEAIAWEQALARVGLQPLPYANVANAALGLRP